MNRKMAYNDISGVSERFLYINVIGLMCEAKNGLMSLKMALECKI